MSEFPKWIYPHESHSLHEVAKLHDIHRDRATGRVTVLVQDADEEAELTSEHHEKDEA